MFWCQGRFSGAINRASAPFTETSHCASKPFTSAGPDHRERYSWPHEQRKCSFLSTGFEPVPLGYAPVLLSIRPCAFFLCFSSPARVAFGWNRQKKNNWGSQNQSRWPSRCHARNTCTLHLKTQLSGRRNFFTVIARRRRKKNFVLLRSLTEVDDRINVSNHYSKKHDARHSCTFSIHDVWAMGKSWGNQAEAFSKRVTRALSGHRKLKAKVLSVEMIKRGLCWE